MKAPSDFTLMTRDQRVAWLSNLTTFELTVLRQAHRRRYGVECSDAVVFATYLAAAERQEN